MSHFQKAGVSVLSVTLSLSIGVCPGEAAWGMAEDRAVGDLGFF